MPRFSTKNDFDKIISKNHTQKTVYTYAKNTQLTLECGTTASSVVYRERVGKKYQKKCIGTANGKTFSEIIDLFHKHITQETSIHPRTHANDKFTLNDYFEKEYVPSVESYKRSIEQDKKFMSQHILPVLGHKEISSITKSDIQTLIKTLASKGQKPTTQRRLIYCLSAVLTHAVACDVLINNPVQHVKKPTSKPSARKIPTFDVFKDILKVARLHKDKKIGCFISAAIRTGARLSEIKNAKWDEIDFDAMTWFFPVTKSNKSRTIVIPPDLISDLRALREEFPDTIYVFQSPRGEKPMSKRHNRWKQFLRDNGFPDIRFHDLRHSFATYTLEQANLTLIELRDHLGHASVQTTQIYTKASHQSTANKLATFMV